MPYFLWIRAFALFVIFVARPYQRMESRTSVPCSINDAQSCTMAGVCAVSADLFPWKIENGTARRRSLQMDIVVLPMEGRCAVSAHLFLW